MRISDWSSDVCSSDLRSRAVGAGARPCFADQPGGADAVRKRAAPAVQGSGPRGVQPLFPPAVAWHVGAVRSEVHTSELQSLMRLSYAVFCLKKKTQPDHSHIMILCS